MPPSASFTVNAPKLNVIVEGRIKMLMGRIRAIMHLAMGDNDYFD